MQRKTAFNPLGGRTKAESKNFTEGVIAQLVEQRTENPCVPGSIPGDTTRTKVKSLIFNDFFFCLYSICPKYVRKSFTILTFIIFTWIIGLIWFYFTSTTNPAIFGQIFKIRVRKILQKWSTAIFSTQIYSQNCDSYDIFNYHISYHKSDISF